METSIYSMGLHETIHEPNGNIEITKVDGGWIYYYVFRQSSIFVPYSPITPPPVVLDTYRLEEVLREIRNTIQQRPY